jgi:hypothetical protein
MNRDLALSCPTLRFAECLPFHNELRTSHEPTPGPSEEGSFV